MATSKASMAVQPHTKIAAMLTAFHQRATLGHGMVGLSGQFRVSYIKECRREIRGFRGPSSPRHGPSATAQCYAKWLRKGWIYLDGSWTKTEARRLVKKQPRPSKQKKDRYKNYAKIKNSVQLLPMDAGAMKRALARRLLEARRRLRIMEEKNKEKDPPAEEGPPGPASSEHWGEWKAEQERAAEDRR